MSNSTHDKVTGKIDELKGSVKEKIGQVTNKPDLEAEGTAEKLSGKVQQKVGDIKKVFEK